MSWQTAVIGAVGLASYKQQGAIGEYNKGVAEREAKVAADKKLEEAKFAIIRGNIAQQNAKLAQINTIAQTGTSLLTMNTGTA
jgi:hypothetical protein